MDPVKCPICSEIFTPNKRLNDGGSYSHCGARFHICNEKYRFGSPGPALCKHCRK